MFMTISLYGTQWDVYYATAVVSGDGEPAVDVINLVIVLDKCQAVINLT